MKKEIGISIDEKTLTLIDEHRETQDGNVTLYDSIDLIVRHEFVLRRTSRHPRESKMITMKGTS